MENLELIKNNILDNLDILDLVLDKISENKEKVKNLIEEIRLKDEAGEDVTNLINEYRTNLSLSFLLNEDLKRYGVVLNTSYRIAKLLNIELNLEEVTLKRLEHNITTDKPFFIKDKQELVPLEANLEENIMQGLKSGNPTINDNILNIIRKTNEQKS